MDAGYGTVLKRYNGATYDAIADVTDISPPGLSRSTIDVSDHSSPTKYAEFIGGLRDAGEVSLTLNYDVTSAAQNKLRDDLETDAANQYQIVFPDAGNQTWGFSGLVTAFEPAAPRDGVITAQVTIKVSGVIDFDV